MVMQEQPEMAGKLIVDMRAAFEARDWDETLTLYEQFLNFKKDRGLHLEATCMAVRALTAAGERSAARAILKNVIGAEYRRAVHYEFLARAFLDLKQYKNAAQACERAESLRCAEEEARRSTNAQAA